MRKKIVGIYVCILLIATTVPSVESLKDNKSYLVTPNNTQIGSQENWLEIQKLLASNGVAYDYFGISVSFDGNTALIGAPGDDDNGVDSGSSYVFTRSGTTWTQQQKLLASDGVAGDWFGWSISLDGDTAFIAARWDDDNGIDSGSVYVFTRSGTTWTQQQKLLASDGAAYDYFGSSVSLDGDTALVGAWLNVGEGNYSGAAYVFIRNSTTWIQQAKLLASDGAELDEFGYSVSLDGDTALIGAIRDDLKGSAYVFTRTDTTWTQQAKLFASDGTTNDDFSCSVSLSGDTAFIGASGDDGYKGSMYVFTRAGTTWTNQQKLLTSDGIAGDEFGCSVSLDSDTALIGAHGYYDYRNDSGSVYVFTHNGTAWTQQEKLLAADGTAGDYFGFSISLVEGTALIGGPLDDDNGVDSGSTYVFTRDDGVFNLEIDIIGTRGVNLKITNNGTTDANNISWQIHVHGGILGRINKTVNNAIDIPAGDTITVGTGMLFGFGAISIKAKVADEEQTATGMQLIIFSMVKK